MAHRMFDFLVRHVYISVYMYTFPNLASDRRTFVSFADEQNLTLCSPHYQRPPTWTFAKQNRAIPAFGQIVQPWPAKHNTCGLTPINPRHIDHGFFQI